LPLHGLPGDHRGRAPRGRGRRRPLTLFGRSLVPEPQRMTKQGLVLDTHHRSAVDDALALAYALRHPDVALRAVTTVSADTTARARIAARLVALADRDDVIVA